MRSALLIHSHYCSICYRSRTNFHFLLPGQLGEESMRAEPERARYFMVRGNSGTKSFGSGTRYLCFTVVGKWGTELDSSVPRSAASSVL